MQINYSVTHAHANSHLNAKYINSYEQHEVTNLS